MARRARQPRAKVRKWDNIAGYCAFAAIYEDVAKSASPGEIFVEIGNYAGRSLAYLATLLDGKGAKIYGIDIGVGGPVAWKKGDQKRRGVTTGKLIRNLYACDLLDKVTLIVADSPKAAHIFPDNSVQFLMVDGDHSHEGVLRDLRAWWPKMRNGGLMVGDDYVRYPTVASAVHEFFDTKSLHDPRHEGSWSAIAIKPDEGNGKPSFRRVV